MKKVYEKPVVDVVEFDLKDNIMSGDTSGELGDLGGSTGVEEW